MFKLNFRTHQYWLFTCLVLVLSASIELLGDGGRGLFSYQNDFAQNGEYWRLWSGHFIHLGWGHFLLNASGLLGVWGLYGKIFRPMFWGVIFLGCCMGISLGFYSFDGQLQTYVGLSGVLHGLVAAAVCYSIFCALHRRYRGFPWEDFVVFAGLWLKVTYEQIIGPVPITETMSGGTVMVNAHLYGTIIGTLFGLGMVVCGGSKSTFESNKALGAY